MRTLKIRAEDGREITVQVVDDSERAGAGTFTPRPCWCACGSSTFGSYPEDGACSCGTYKHHVHCGSCGGITQVG